MMNQTWNERYNTEDYYYGKEANDFLKEASSYLKSHSKILCLAEGEGRNAVFLARLGHHVTALDYSSVGQQKTQKLAKENNVHVDCIEADLTTYKLENVTWDVIVSIWCHIPSEARHRLYQQIASSLKPGGYFILEAYTPRQIPLKTGGPKDPDFLPTEEQLRKDLASLHLLKCQEIQREIHEGRGHTGFSEVVQTLAQKM
ncbi:MAG: class I SAM-dependent methyltransferase [Bdellovibrionaceae bacterium]|nr:class I SAM-dependent methyltransferase [Pseudobdellovibrionaceae bacterium]